MKRYRKPYRVRRKKPILRKRFFWLTLLSLVFAGGVFYILFFSPLFQVKRVVISGQERVLEEQLRFLIGNERKSIFLVNAADIERNILNNIPQIAEAKVKRVFPSSIDISVRERIPVAVWCEAERCFFIDGQGIIFGEAPPENNLIKIFGQKELLGKERLSQILEIQSKLKDDLKILAPEVNLVSEERFDVKTSERWDIYFNSKGDLDWQIKELVLVLEKQIPQEKRNRLDYIDLRFSRVYYKYLERR